MGTDCWCSQNWYRLYWPTAAWLYMNCAMQSTSKLPPTSLQRAVHREQRWHIELHRPQLWVFHECQAVGIVTNCTWIVSSCKKLQESRQTPSYWKKRALQSYSHIPHLLPGPPTSEKIFKVLSHKEPGVLGRMHGTSCQMMELATLDLFSTRDPTMTHISWAAHSLRSSPHPRERDPSCLLFMIYYCPPGYYIHFNLRDLDSEKGSGYFRKITTESSLSHHTLSHYTVYHCILLRHLAILICITSSYRPHCITHHRAGTLGRSLCNACTWRECQKQEPTPKLSLLQSKELQNALKQRAQSDGTTSTATRSATTTISRSSSSSSTTTIRRTTMTTTATTTGSRIIQQPGLFIHFVGVLVS